MINHSDYFHFLLKRSRLGLWYRKYWLYPFLCSKLSGTVLDVGCGIGDMVRFRANTVGVDINPLSVEYCVSQGLDVRCMESDKLPFADGSFQGVILDNVLEHLVEPGPLLAEIARILAPRGRVIVGVPGEKGYASDDDHKIFYSEEGLIARMCPAGFKVECVRHMPVRWEWLSRKSKLYALYGVFSLR